MSREASLEMESDPTGDSVSPTGTELVSMFQTNSVAIRAERWINWKRRRTAAVAVISGVNYGSNREANAKGGRGNPAILHGKIRYLQRTHDSVTGDVKTVDDRCARVLVLLGKAEYFTEVTTGEEE